MLEERLESLDGYLDAISLGKRLQIEAEHLKRIKCTKILRIYTTPSAGVLTINTRIIDALKAEDGTKLWDLVKRVVVCANGTLPIPTDEDAGNQKENRDKNADGTAQDAVGVDPRSPSPDRQSEADIELWEWTKASCAEAFEISRGEGHRSIQLLLKLVNARQVYKLSTGIRSLFGKHSDTKQNIIKDFYKYINTNKLNDYATAVVACDEKLSGILGVESFHFSDLGSIVDGLVEPVGYCVINVDLAAPQIWDLPIECDDLSQMPVLYPKNVQEMEKKIEANQIVFQKISEKISVLEEFVEDPVFFINRKIALESDCLGVQTAFYDDLSVQTAVFELIRRHDK